MAVLRYNFQATVVPAWEYWVVHVPDADNLHAIVLNPADAERVARDAISVLLGLDPETISIALSGLDDDDTEGPAVGRRPT